MAIVVKLIAFEAVVCAMLNRGREKPILRRNSNCFKVLVLILKYIKIYKFEKKTWMVIISSIRANLEV